MKKTDLSAQMSSYLRQSQQETADKAHETCLAMLRKIVDTYKEYSAKLTEEVDYLDFLLELEKTAEVNDFGDDEWAALLDIPTDEDSNCGENESALSYEVLQEMAGAKIFDVRLEAMETLLTAIAETLAGLDCMDVKERDMLLNKAGLLGSLRWLKQGVEDGDFDEDELDGIAKTLRVSSDGEDESGEDEDGDGVLKTMVILPFKH